MGVNIATQSWPTLLARMRPCSWLAKGSHLQGGIAWRVQLIKGLRLLQQRCGMQINDRIMRPAVSWLQGTVESAAAEQDGVQV